MGRQVAGLVAIVLCLLSGRGGHSQTAVAVAAGVRVSVPSGWQWQSEVAQLSGPILLTNFAAAYDRGGFIPPGGAEIEIVRMPAPSGGLGDYVREELKEAAIESSQEMQIGAADALRFAYTDSFGTVLSYKNVTYYILRGGSLYKFYLTARTGEPHWSSWVAAFDRLAAGVAFPE